MKRFKITDDLRDRIRNSGHSLCKLSRLTGIHVGNICYHNDSISEDQLNRLGKVLNTGKLNLKEINIYTSKNLGKHAFPKEIRTPAEKSEKLAEFVGMVLGDGCITDYDGSANNNYYKGVRIAGHSKDDYSYLMRYVKNLVKDLFGAEPYFYKAKDKKLIHLCLQSKKLVEYLYTIGLKSGNKKDNDVSIPDWIFEDKMYMIACLRGLIDTDGCVCPITGYKYSNIWFKSAIPNLRKSFSRLTRALGIRTTNWSGKKVPQIYIGRKAMIRKYYYLVGFNNPKHTRRFLMPD